ncbi:MAG: hypothetical protein ACYTBJ_00150 [Planctomycetota bacterium]|jgi:hypothetical protein
MLNPTAYGKTSSAPGIGVLGVAGLDIEKIIAEGKDALSDVTGENLTLIGEQPSQEIAQRVGEQLAAAHGEAVGEAAAKEAWTNIRPYAIGGVLLLAGILAVVIARRK